MNKRIELQNVIQSFVAGDGKLEVIKNVNFSIVENSFTIIYGQSGSGKSTVLNIISGLQKPTSGTVLFSGKDIYSLSSDEIASFRAKNIGIIYQTNYWVKSLNVLENVALPIYFSGKSRHRANSQAMKALKQVGMDTYAKRQPFLLSGGEQQRVAIARAIVDEPSVIIADEPTGNLDIENGDKIVRLLEDYIKETNCTVVMVTHNMEYLPIADHLLHIQDGIVEDLKSESYQQMTKQLLADLKQRIDSLATKRKKQNAK